MSEQKIDFVILWVDGNDPKWQEEKAKYQRGTQTDDRVQRYRDWENLQYWFRGVEKFAPWVNRIHFITWGHLPPWLNCVHPKLHIVKHTDYIPEKYLPTFNSNVIELNLHHLQGLAEQFVLFNDDTFIIAPVKETDFFKNNMPCDSAALNVHCIDANFGFNYSTYQAIGVINKYFDFHKCILQNWRKWLNPKNGKELLRTLYLLPCPRFPGIYQPHLPNAFLKSTFETIWEKEYAAFDETCTHRFRDKLDYSHWTMRNWQLASGKFENRSIRFGKSFFLDKGKNDLNTAREYLVKQKGKLYSINDGEMREEEFQENKAKILQAFDSILPEKSSFEL